MKNCSENQQISIDDCYSQELDSPYLNKKYSLKEISEILPAIVHINSLDDFSLKYINTFGEEQFGMQMGEIIAKKDNFLNEIFEPGTLEYFAKPLIQKIKDDDRSRIVSFFQKVRLNNSGFKWILTTSKFLKNRNESISISQEITGKDALTEALTELLDEYLYFRNNIKKFERLSKREKQILKMVTQGMSTKEIAKELYISPQTVNTHRKNIRKKLELKSGIDWEYFAKTFDL